MRVLRWLGLGVLLLIVLVAGAAAYAVSHHGLNTLAQWGLKRYNATFVGQVQVRELQRHGTALTLLDVSVLYNGVVVAHVDQVKVQPHWKTLRPQNISIDTFDLLRPTLLLQKDAADGKFTVAKALEPKQEEPKKDSSHKKSNPPKVTLGRLHVENAAVRYVGPPQELAVAKIDLDVHASVAWPRIEALTVSVAGQLEKPDRLPFRLRAEAQGLAPEGLNGHVALSVDNGVVQGIAFKDVAIDAAVKDGIATIARLQANVDGNELRVSGRAGPWKTLLTPFAVNASVELADLAGTASRLRTFGVDVPPLAGSGELTVNAEGTPLAPVVKATGKFAQLQADTMRVEALALSPITGGKLQNEHRLVLQGVQVDKQALGTLTVQAGLLKGMTLQGTLLVQHPGANVQARYELPLLALKADNTVPLPLSFDVTATVPSITKAARAFGVRGPPLEGNVQATLSVSGTLGGPAFPDVNVKVEARRLRLGQQSLGDVAATVLMPAGQSLAAEVDFTNPQAIQRSHIRLRGRWRRPLDVRDAQAWRAAIMRMTFDTDVDVKGADLAALKTLAQPSLPPTSLAAFEGLQGDAALQMHAKGSMTSVQGQLDLVVHEVRTNRFPATNITLQTNIMPARSNLDLRVDTVAKVNNLQLAERSDVRFRGRWRTPGNLQNPNAWRAAIMRMTYDADVDVKGVDLAVLKTLAAATARPGALAALEGLKGRAGLQAHAKGSLQSAQGTLSLLVDRARTNRFPATNVNLQANLTTTDANLSLRIDTVAKGNAARLVMLTAQGRPAGRMLDVKAWQHADVQWQAELGPLRMQQIQSFAPEPSQFTMEPMQGRFHALMSGKGTLPAPNAHVEVTVSQIKRGTRALGEIDIKADYEKMIPKLVAHLTSANGGTFDVNVHTTRPLPLAPLPAREALPPTNVNVTATAFNLALFDGWIESLRGVGGMMNGHLNVGGTMAAPKFEGNLSVKDGSVEVIEVARFEDIDVRMKAAPGQLILEAFNFESGAGRGEMTAKLERTGKDAMALTGALKLRRFPLQAPQRKLGELDLNAGWKGTVTLSKLTIEPLHIREARVYAERAKAKALQDLDRPDDLVLFNGGQPATKAERKKYAGLVAKEAVRDDQANAVAPAGLALPALGSYPMFIHVKAPRNIWVRGDDGSLELGLGDNFRIEREDGLEIYGSVFVRRGRVSVLGRAFEIRDTSEVKFMGEPGNPQLDCTVDHFNDQEQVQITITVKGRAENLNVKFTSNPPLAQTEILSILLTGRREPVGAGGARGGGGQPQQQAAALAGGMLASKLRGTILRRLPVDVLSISANAIEAGTYVTDRLYVGYVRRLLAQPWRYENQNALHLEYQLTPRWSFEGEYGDVGSGSGDLVWKKNY
ncbi:MAG: translocation/assembly module TamB domain-containing protein [Deltaproteobacteria bacterium]|nr:translocation/assembly module TamB domain-containing protein [Deltaproteobacteria bacterium]